MQIKDVTGAKIWVMRVAVPSRDFQLVLAGAAVLFVLVALGDQVWFLKPLRLIVGLVYIFFVPGYCLTAALFPRNDDLEGIERLGLNVGLSIAQISLLALVLDRLPWGLRQWPILLAEYGAISLCMAIALWRRSLVPPKAAYAPVLRPKPRRWWRLLLPLERRIYMLLAGALLLVSLLGAWIFLVPASDEFMTEFYVLGQRGMAEQYPYQVSASDTLTVTLGIANREREEHSYRVEVWASDGLQFGRRMLVAKSGPFVLQPGQEYRDSISWLMPWVGDNQEIELLLFSNTGSSPYRQLRLWVNAKS